MRVKPIIELNYNQTYLTRWDQYTSLDPLLVCATCRFYDEKGHHCINKLNIKNNNNITLWDIPIDSVVCGEHSISSALKPYLRKNPYFEIANNYRFSDEKNHIREKISKEIDLTINLKGKEKKPILINDVNFSKSISDSKVYLIWGYLIDKNEEFSERVDNKLAERKISNNIIIRKFQIKSIEVIKNGDIRIFNDLLEFDKQW